MVVLIVLLVSWLALRGIGEAGVHALASWQGSARYALIVMFIFTATAHFNKMKHDLARVIPPYFPRPLLLDGSYRRHDNIVIAGSPLRLFRLSRPPAVASSRRSSQRARHPPATPS